ncbi:MAG TPA: TetR/AcrR family transcriptional regulator [Solirubrobacteraceae bacterium]|nr:TetR/AcrR family transcriptional regulator [Solirubrobacteraceae bacterium]
MSAEGAPTTTREQRASRRESLVRAAIDVMAEQGMAQSRLADVANRAGISPGQVLYYFESKADLFLHALRTIEADLRREVLAAGSELHSAAERWEHLLQLAAPTGAGDFRLLLWLEAWELAPRDPYVAAQVQQLEDQWQAMVLDILRYGRERGELACDDLESFVMRFSALMDGLTIQVVVGSPRVSRETMLTICRQMAQQELRWRT